MCVCVCVCMRACTCVSLREALSVESVAVARACFYLGFQFIFGLSKAHALVVQLIHLGLDGRARSLVLS